jgi:hypothetical protein
MEALIRSAIERQARKLLERDNRKRFTAKKYQRRYKLRTGNVPIVGRTKPQVRGQFILTLTGWQADGHVQINQFDLARLRSFLSILTSLDLRDTGKAKISLQDVEVEALSTLLASSGGAALIRELSASPELPEDIYAVAKKRRALEEFENNLSQRLSESEWQRFFEINPWIFGHGLNYIFLDKVGSKLEVATTGATFDQSGKRADGLMRTRAEVSQYVLVAIKRDETSLLQMKAYRPGCWAVSQDLSDAVTQVQKTVFEFGKNRFRDRLKDEAGNDLPGEVYAVEPRSYLVIGNLSELGGNDDKVTCFELYRRNIRAPEILTFDELHQRAKCIVENISRSVEGSAR